MKKAKKKKVPWGERPENQKTPSLVSAADQAKKWFACLGCGKPMWTDRCHRICKKCRRRIDAEDDKKSHRVALGHEAMRGWEDEGNRGY